MNIDAKDVVKMLVAILDDRYTSYPATCTSCKDPSGRLIRSEKAILIAKDYLRTDVERGEERITQILDATLQSDATGASSSVREEAEDR